MVEFVAGRCAASLMLLALLSKPLLTSVPDRFKLWPREWRHLEMSVRPIDGRWEKSPEDPNKTFQMTRVRRNVEIKATTELSRLEGNEEIETVQTSDGKSCIGKNVSVIPETKLDDYKGGKQKGPPPNDFHALLERVMNILDKHLKSDLENTSSEGFRKSLNLLKRTFMRDELIRDLEKGLTEESLVKDPIARNVQSWQVLVHYIRFRMHEVGLERMSESMSNSWRRLQADWNLMRRSFPEVPKFLFSKDGTIRRGTEIWNGGEIGDPESRVEVAINGRRRLKFMYPYQFPPGVFFVKDL